MSFLRSFLRLSAATLISLGLAACGGGGGGGNGDPVNQDPDAPPTVISTAPADNQTAVDPQIRIEFVFDKTIDPASVQREDVILDSSSGDLEVRAIGAIDNRIVVTPEGLLDRGALITARLLTTIADTDGNALENEFVLRFSTEDATEVASLPHENVAEAARLGLMEMDANGDGMSVFRVGSDKIYFRRIENGHSVGDATELVSQDGTYPRRGNLSIASNGDVQLTYATYAGGRTNLRLTRWDAVTETWSSHLLLTPSPLAQVDEYKSDADIFGGMVVWSEESVNDTDKQAIRVGFPEANGFMEEPRTLRLADARRYSIQFDRQGTQSVIAWVEKDAQDGARVAVVSHDRVTGFTGIQNPTPLGRIAGIRGVAAAPNGYRFLLATVNNANDNDQKSLSLLVAPPGQSSFQLSSVYNGEAELLVAKLYVNEAGIAAVAYARRDGQPGMYVRRYVPGSGFEQAVEITGVGRVPYGIGTRAIDVDLDSTGNIMALASHRGDGYAQVISAALLPRVGAPQVGIVLDRAVKSPTGPRVLILRHPNTSAQMVWTHDNADAISDYDIRSRRMAPNGVAGPFQYYSTETDVVASDLFGAFAPSGRGLLIWSELHGNVPEIREIRYFQ